MYNIYTISAYLCIYVHLYMYTFIYISGGKIPGKAKVWFFLVLQNMAKF